MVFLEVDCDNSSFGRWLFRISHQVVIAKIWRVPCDLIPERALMLKFVEIRSLVNSVVRHWTHAKRDLSLLLKRFLWVLVESQGDGNLRDTRHRRRVVVWLPYWSDVLRLKGHSGGLSHVDVVLHPSSVKKWHVGLHMHRIWSIHMKIWIGWLLRVLWKN